jgi:hypothetical protein
LKKEIEGDKEQEVMIKMQGENPVEFWKKKYLYPFGDICPIGDHDEKHLMDSISHPEQFNKDDLNRF